MNSDFDSIADGLASEGYAIVDQFLSQDEVNSVLQLDDFKKRTDQFRKAGIGRQQNVRINETIRGDYIQWVDKITAPAAIKLYLDRLNELMEFLNRSLFLSLKDFEVHQTIYPPGSFYKRHLDQFQKGDHRKLSVICYLNDNWHEENGGQLRIYHPDGAKNILPIAGRLVCFRSDQLEHEVLPATRDRLSLTGWLLDQVRDLKNL